MTRRSPWPLLGLALGLTGPVQATAQAERLTLHDAVGLALDFHPRVAAARAARHGSAAMLGTAKAERIPTAAAEGEVTRYQLPMLVAPLHELTATTLPQFDPALVRGRVTAGYTLFDGGRRGATIDQAEAGERSAAAGVAVAELAVMEEVTLAYLEVLSAEGVADADRRRVESLEAEKQRAEQLLAEGRAARVEVLRVDAALASARADRIATDTDLDLSRRRLARLLGVPFESIAASQLVAVTAVDAPAVGDDLLTTARLTNPDLDRARQRAAADSSGERAARATWFPTLRLNGAYLLYGTTTGNFTAEWQAGLVLSYPLFTGGARTNQIRLAEARATQAREEVRQVELQVEAAIDGALARFRESEARVTALTAATEHFAEVARIEQLSLTTGGGTQTDYLAAEAALFRVRADLVRARHAAIGARVSLARVSGELSVEWLDAFLEGAL